MFSKDTTTLCPTDTWSRFGLLDFVRDHGISLSLPFMHGPCGPARAGFIAFSSGTENVARCPVTWGHQMKYMGAPR
jgi:hypothetical protein